MKKCKTILEIQPSSHTMKTSLFLLILLGSYLAVAQSSEVVEIRNAKWVDFRVGLVADLEGKIFEFPSISLGIGGNFNTKPLLYTLRLNLNSQIPVLADASGNAIWDLDFLIGKYFDRGSNRKMKITVSGGIGMIWGTTGGSSPFSSAPEKDISGLGFAMEARIFWIKRKSGWGFSIMANVNSKVHYLGGAFYIPIGSFGTIE